MTYLKILILLILLLPKLSISQVERINIQGKIVEFRTTSTNEDTQTETLTLFTGDKELASLILSDFDGDCSSENIELGTYKIIENSIIFYSYWASADRMQKNTYPYGFRKEQYRFDTNGELVLKATELYIETYVDDWTVHQGMTFLNTNPKSEHDLNLKNDYIAKAENMYQSHFVLGTEKQKLEQEVRKVLAAEIKKNTGYWAEVYGKNSKH
ncbi:hypothetical protein I2486_13935 [Cellulophaga sp. E16_2]|uniref:hypothetical protein n=1 Tax=unclassified Cellulophaga TaxID=2634405 RepID=UPI0013FE0684|nr:MULTISPECIES: hypothetical protein [unclassified Cellulophaga]MBO0592502.1 hypothetical protein [Cellulophaga sp. E16_2]